MCIRDRESIYDKQADIYPLPCPGLMEFVEQGILSGEKLENFLHNLLDPYKDKDITGIVLGCTHYPFLKDTIQKIVGPSVTIFDGGYGLSLIHISFNYDLLLEEYLIYF